jgi:hypothetical protein
MGITVIGDYNRRVEKRKMEANAVWKAEDLKEVSRAISS